MTTQTTTTPAVSPLMEIALRIREMRRITGFTEKEMAEKTGVTEAEYRSYETGTVDLPFTFLHKCSLAFGLELTDLLEGQSAKLSSYRVTRRGCGLITAAAAGKGGQEEGQGQNKSREFFCFSVSVLHFCCTSRCIINQKVEVDQKIRFMTSLLGTEQLQMYLWVNLKIRVFK